ncbi:hypothetical protein [Bacillus aryabhattai]|uniref:hypothetical protein n=1 Tax=Priestia aryabhattai TaxID=412384 RepID=UPI0012DAD24D
MRPDRSGRPGKAKPYTEVNNGVTREHTSVFISCSSLDWDDFVMSQSLLVK